MMRVCAPYSYEDEIAPVRAELVAQLSLADCSPSAVLSIGVYTPILQIPRLHVCSFYPNASAVRPQVDKPSRTTLEQEVIAIPAHVRPLEDQFACVPNVEGCLEVP